MTKTAGMGDQLYVGGVDVSGDTMAIGDIGGGPVLWEVPGISAQAQERIGLHRDGRMNLTSYFNPAVGAAHKTWSPLPTANVGLMYCRGSAIGGESANLIGKQVNYDATRANDGALTFGVQAAGNGFGLEWTTQLTPGQVLIGGAGAQAGVDFTAATSFGLQAYLQVLLFTGTSATVAIQDFTADTPGSYTDITGAVFAPATAIGTQRIQTTRTQTVRRWCRVNVTGTFTALLFAVGIAKNLSQTDF